MKNYNFGKEEYTKKNMTPTDIQDLAFAYSHEKLKNLLGNKLDNRIRVSNDLAKLTGGTQRKAGLQSGNKALILFLLKDKLVTTSEYKELYTKLVDIHSKVIKGLNNASPESRNTGGTSSRVAMKDMKDESLKEDEVEGGLSDGMTLQDIANKHKIDIDQLLPEFKMGYKVEREHTDNPKIAKEIALDHLFEDPNYYTKLDKMENEGISPNPKKKGYVKYFKTAMKKAGITNIKSLSDSEKQDFFNKIDKSWKSKSESINEVKLLGLSGVKSFAKKHGFTVKVKSSRNNDKVTISKDGKILGIFDPSITTKTSLAKKLNITEDAKKVWKKGKVLFVDSDFVNFSKGKLPNSELKHAGMGDFFLDTPNGKVYFIRTSDKFDGMSGRAHRISDNEQGGKLIAQLIKKMGATIVNESINEESKEEHDANDFYGRIKSGKLLDKLFKGKFDRTKFKTFLNDIVTKSSSRTSNTKIESVIKIWSRLLNLNAKKYIGGEIIEDIEFVEDATKQAEKYYNIFKNKSESINERQSAISHAEDILKNKGAYETDISKVIGIVNNRIKSIEKQPGSRKLTDEKYKLQNLLKKLDKQKSSPRKIKEDVNESNSEPEVITQLRGIVKGHQSEKIKDTKTGKKQLVDVTTASLVTQVFDALKKPANKEKFVSSGLRGMVILSWKMTKK